MKVGKAKNENHHNFGPKEIGYFYSCVLVTQSCPTLYDPIDYSPPDSFVHGIFQARILEWVAIPFSSGPHFVKTLHPDPSISLG